MSMNFNFTEMTCQLLGISIALLVPASLKNNSEKYSIGTIIIVRLWPYGPRRFRVLENLRHSSLNLSVALENIRNSRVISRTRSTRRSMRKTLLWRKVQDGRGSYVAASGPLHFGFDSLAFHTCPASRYDACEHFRCNRLERARRYLC